MDGLREKSKINGCFGWIIVLWASHQRAFIFNAEDIHQLDITGTKSLNIKKIDKWNIKYSEIQTIPNNRKQLLDYTGEIEDHLERLR